MEAGTAERATGWRWTGRRTAALAGAVAVAVGAVVWVVAGTATADDRLYVVDGDGAISLVDPASGATIFSVPGATATPDRSALLTTEAAGDDTVLVSHDPEDGAVTGSTRLDGAGLTVRTVSPQGGAVALLPGPRGAGLYEPEGRERTSLTVSFLDDREPRTFDLEGNLEPEMFAYDETGLFVLDFVPPVEPTSYFVRRLDLATGELTDTGAPQVGLDPRMRGKARASVLHPDGDQLFTLYTLPEGVEPFEPFEPLDADQSHGPDHAGHDVGSDGLHAFIHVIDLREDWSYCIFLPDPIGTVEEATVGMGISPDGAEVVVADPSTSTIVTVDTDSLEVTGTTAVPQFGTDGSAEPPQSRVAMAGDGTLYLGSGTELLELGRPGFAVTRAWFQAATIEAISLSASGDQLRVGGGGGITLIDRATGAETGVLRPPGSGVVALLGPPQGSVTQFPLECAC